MKFCKTILATLGLLASSAAYAADMPTKAPLYQPAVGFNWSGIYIGGEAGYGFSAKQLDVTGGNSTLATVTNPGSIGPNASGGVGGLTAALRYQPGTGPWVFGITGAFDITGINSSANPDIGTTLAAIAATGMTAPAGSVSIPWDARVGAEIGYAVIPNLLLFADGGAAFGEIKLNSTAVNLAAPINQALVTANTDNVHVGWFAGAGVKYAVLPNVIIGAHYLYEHLGTHGVTFQGTGPAAATAFNVKDTAATNRFMGTLELKF